GDPAPARPDDSSPARRAFRRDTAGARLVRPGGRLPSRGAHLLGASTVCGSPPIHRAHRRLAPWLDRHPLLASLATLVSTSAAGVARRGGPAPRARAARLRRRRPRSGTPRARARRNGAAPPAESATRAERGGDAEASRGWHRPRVRRRAHADVARPGGTAVLHAPLAGGPHRLSGRSGRPRPDRLHHPRGEPVRLCASRVRLWRARAMLHLPRAD